MERNSDYGAFMKKFLLHQSSSEIELPLNSLVQKLAYPFKFYFFFLVQFIISILLVHGNSLSYTFIHIFLCFLVDVSAIKTLLGKPILVCSTVQIYKLYRLGFIFDAVICQCACVWLISYFFFIKPKNGGRFDVDGHVTRFGNPDWIKTHSAATSTAPVVLAILSAGATCVGTTVMDEMAYSINGENEHYGTPKNPFAPDRVPGGSSSGSAVAVGANIVDFSLGTDTGGSVRVPASYCGIFGLRPSHGVISTPGVIPMAQSFDTVGDLIKHVRLGDYVQEKVPILKCFLSEGNADKEYNIPSLAALSSAMRLLQRYEFKNNHGEWVTTVKPNLGLGISERVWEAMRTTDENIDVCHSVKAELRAVLTNLLGDHGALAIPTVPGHPPKLQTATNTLENFRARAFSLLSIAGVSGFCQVSIPLGLYENIPVSVSLLAKHSSDGFLLNLVETLYDTLKEKVEIAINMSS